MPSKSSFAYGAGFRSLTREIANPVALPVKGKLPSWLEGTLLRTGPSKFEVGTRTYNHWFDGLVHPLPSVRPETGVLRQGLEAAGHREGEVTCHFSPRRYTL